MEIIIRQMNQASAEMIADTWKYEGEYSFYDMTADPEDYDEIISPDKRGTHYFEIEQAGRLIGFSYIAPNKEVSIIEFGIGIRPDMTGKGMGQAIVDGVLRFIEKNYPLEKISLSVATFNKRAITVYKRVGFVEVQKIHHKTNGGVFEFLKMEKRIKK